MNCKQIMFCVFLFFCFLLHTAAIDLDGKTYYSSIDAGDYITFNNEYFEYVQYDGLPTPDAKTEVMRKRYKVIIKNKLQYIVYGEDFEPEWFALNNEYTLFLYDQDDTEPFFVGMKNPGYFESTSFYNPNTFNSSSFLIESSIHYIAEDLNNNAIPRPWVEGAEGAGINESITIKRTEVMVGFSISNGYVSMDRPDLYTKNNRLKKIKVIDITNNSEYFFDLEDTPNFQHFFFDEDVYEFRIIILEVFRGTQYDDTCVNYMYIM